MDDVEALRTRLVECVRLKSVERTGWVRAGVKNAESVAGHSWGVAWLVLVLAPPELDRERALAMAIVHDLPEVRTGDRVPATAEERAEKHVAEERAMRGLVESLPGADELLALFLAYESQDCPESRFVKACDLLDMALQAAVYADSIDVSEFVQSALSRLDDPTLSLLALGIEHSQSP